MAYRKRYYPMKRRGRRYVPKRTYRRRSTKKIARVAKKVIQRNAEHKYFQTCLTNVQVPNAGGVSGNTPTIVNLLPTIEQGTARAERVGNKIRVVNASIKIHCRVNPNPNLIVGSMSAQTYGPIYAKFWVVSNKQTNNSANFGWSSFFKQDGDTSTPFTSFSGSMNDMFRKVDNTRWTVYKSKMVKIAVGGPFSSVATSQFSMQDASSRPAAMFAFPLTKLTGTLDFADAVPGGAVPTNKNLFLVCQAVYWNSDLTQYVPVYIDYGLQHTYIDL